MQGGFSVTDLLSLFSASIFAAALVAPANAQDLPIGETLYQQYCATCHGMSGEGDGPLGEVISVPIPDLTQISARNDGAFPMLKVIHVIDGRTGLRGHGGPMPVYGAIFTRDAVAARDPIGAAIEARGRVMSLAEYLITLQK